MPDGLVFHSPTGARVEVKRRVVNRMLAVARNGAVSDEGGGILIGRRVLDSADMVIDKVTLPFPTDLRSRFGFLRRRQGHQQALDAAWRNSGEVATYLGEWHTHPSPTAEPSSQDLQNWRVLTKEHGARLVFLIVSTIGAIGCWGDEGKWEEER
jgi:integrative and conjugative element protein (TIGR02256 family)